MPQPPKLHLFNCDRIYDLDIVEDLLTATEAKIGFSFLVEKHYFSLSQMSELSAKIIPQLQMDCAFFVVHAHEARLSINEDDRGYTKVYKALLQATGKNLCIVDTHGNNTRKKTIESYSTHKRNHVTFITRNNDNILFVV